MCIFLEEMSNESEHGTSDTDSSMTYKWCLHNIIIYIYKYICIFLYFYSPS